MESLGLSMYRTVSSANMALVLPFQFGCSFFFSQPPARASGYSVDSGVEGGHPSLVPDVRVKALVLYPLSVMLAVYARCLLTNLRTC